MSPKPHHGTSPFLDVTPPGRKAPSWIAKHRAPALDLHSLKAAPIPQEFLDAVQAEVALSATKLEESVALQRATRPPSELPPKTERGRVALTSRSNGSSTPAAKRALGSEPSSPFAAQLSPLSTPQMSEETREALRQAIENLVHARSMVLQTAAGQLAELAATIARRVISHELGVNPAIVRKLVDEGLQALEREDRVLVRVGPGFAEEQPHLLEQFGTEGGHVDVVVDATLSHFGCVVETEHGWVDESIESRLAALLQELRSDSVPG
jgi:Flagellar assembly protein FliH